MSLFRFDTKTAGVNLFPPDKRFNNNMNYVWSLLSTLQWSFDTFFKSYYEGEYTSYSAVTYKLNDNVEYLGHIYTSLKDDNTDLPTVASSWLLVNNDFIGAKERSNIVGSVISLEYILNKEFKTSYNYPSQNAIYITNVTIEFIQFDVARTFGSGVGQTTSTAGVGQTGTINTTPNIEIHVPLATYNLYGLERIEGFIDTYINAGIKYTVISY